MVLAIKEDIELAESMRGNADSLIRNDANTVSLEYFAKYYQIISISAKNFSTNKKLAMDNKKSEEKEKVLNKATEILDLMDGVGQFMEALALATAAVIYVAQENYGADAEMETKIFGEKMRRYVSDMKTFGIRPMKWKMNKPTKNSEKRQWKKD